MKIQLKVLFVVVAIAAVISYWLLQRQQPILGGALVQVIGPVTGTSTTAELKSEFEKTFYTRLTQKLTAEQPQIVIGSGDPEVQIRESIRCVSRFESEHSVLYMVGAWGNATASRQRLETMMKAAVEVMFTMSSEKSRPSQTKVLQAPSF